MRRLRHIVLAVVVPLTIAGVGPGVASAKGYQDVIHDCAQDGKLDHTYSHQELNQALHHIPSDIDEYTDCRAAITQALGQRGGGGTGSAPYNPALTTNAGATAYNQNDYNSLKSQANADSGSSNAPDVAVGSHDLPVGGKGALFRNAAAANSIPPSLLG
jgi:hypothetical protein